MLLIYPVIRRERFGARGIHIPTSGMLKKGNHFQMAARFSYFHVSVFLNFSWIVVSISMQLYNIYTSMCVSYRRCIKQSWLHVGISNRRGFILISSTFRGDSLDGGFRALSKSSSKLAKLSDWKSGWIRWFMIDITYITWYNYSFHGFRMVSFMVYNVFFFHGL